MRRTAGLVRNVSAGLAVLVLMGGGVPALADKHGGHDVGAAIDAALAGGHRADGNAARDIYRHPKETLTFFGLEPDMTVVEIYPGGGWYTEVLAPVVADRGKLIAAHSDMNGSAYGRRSLGAFLVKLGENNDAYGKVKVSPTARPDDIAQASEGQADMVLTFRNVHNWMASGTAEAMFQAMFAALKPGGILGVVEHRWPEDKPQDPRAANGYVQESAVRIFAEGAGFVYSGASEVNANPQDTKDHPRGVWTLPPVLRLGDTDRVKYEAIGESDRMTLKFVKPEQ